MHLCFEQDPDVRPDACQVKDLVEELCYRNDIWDTSLPRRRFYGMKNELP